jgi:polysaccharide deacetylase family protein (PEP-CTERM system associated)
MTTRTRIAGTGGADIRRGPQTMAISEDGSVLIRNAMTVDVEDFFQVQAFASCIDRGSWDNAPRRVENNTDRILSLFSDVGITATFFTLGWVAQRHPDLVRRIVEQGHELASHGFAHIPVHEQSPDEFRQDVRNTKRLLEDVGGVPVKGYRAASFSIGAKTLWAFDVLASEGYEYSSSIYPIVHDLYGMPNAPRFAHRPEGRGIAEIPMTTLSLFGRNFPCSGGGYFRLLPYPLSRWALRRVNARERQPCIFYFHPWEIDPDQPRVAGAPLKSRVRHYLNLQRMEGRLRRLLKDFVWGRMDDVFLGRVGTTG